MPPTFLSPTFLPIAQNCRIPKNTRSGPKKSTPSHLWSPEPVLLFEPNPYLDQKKQINKLITKSFRKKKNYRNKITKIKQKEPTPANSQLFDPSNVKDFRGKRRPGDAAGLSTSPHRPLSETSVPRGRCLRDPSLKESSLVTKHNYGLS